MATQIGNNGNFIRTSEPIVVNTWYHLEIKQVLDKNDNKVSDVFINHKHMTYVILIICFSIILKPALME